MSIRCLLDVYWMYIRCILYGTIHTTSSDTPLNRAMETPRNDRLARSKFDLNSWGIPCINR